MPYAFLEELAIADLAFRAWGETLEQTFADAAEATVGAMVRDPGAIAPRQQYPIRLSHAQLDLLLFEFLQELLYYKDRDRLLLRPGDLAIATAGSRHELSATLHGEPLDPERHAQGVDVKAITLHQFALERADRGWTAFVILDV